MSGLFSKLLKVLQFFVEYAQDLFQFIRYNGYSPLVSRQKRLYYKLLIETHTLEKGLSLAAPKLLFGRDKLRFVMNTLRDYDPAYSPLPVEMALGALAAYVRFHRERKVVDPLLDEVEAFMAAWHQRGAFAESGGVKSFAGMAATGAGAAGLLASRASCRMFDPVPLPAEVLEQVVALAQRAPSQCNRQSSHAHVYQDPALIAELLALQGGSRGFAETVGNLVVVSSDVAAWGGAGQRNQLYVDGALFSMGVLLGAHAQGLLACPLNLAVTNRVEQRIKKVGGIPADERLIMMIALGQPMAGELRVASSPRRDVHEILQMHTAGQTSR